MPVSPSELHQLFPPESVNAVAIALREKGYVVMFGRPWDHEGRFMVACTIKHATKKIRGYLGDFTFSIKDSDGAVCEHFTDDKSSDPEVVAERFCKWIRRRFSRVN